MSHDAMDERRRALEDAFFAAQDRALLDRMRQADAGSDPRAALRSASGLSDEGVLDHIAGLGVDASSFAALSLVPLVAVAWADGNPDAKERDAIMQAAAGSGVGPSSPAHAILSRWLQAQPGEDLIRVWEEYVRAATGRMSPAERAALHAQVMGRARRVAEATGGFLGLTGGISEAEAVVLRRLEAAFGH